MQMKKMNLWLLSSLFVGALALTACSDNDDNGGGGGTVTPTNPVNPATMKMAALTGFVFDKDGNALSGVQVSTGAESTTTDSNGGFAFKSVGTRAAGGAKRTVVTFKKNGYVSITRAANFAEADIWEVVMAETGITHSFESFSDHFLEDNVSDMSVGFQANGFVDSEGNPFSGTVNADILYLSPDDENFGAMMPGGDLAAVRGDGTEAQLVSYGMTLVNLKDNWEEPLNIGTPATVKFPVPEKFKGNEPAEIPLWGFNEETGLWEEEGTAYYNEAEGVYEGTVPHFSWVNLDYPEVRTTLKVIVKDEAGNLIPYIKVDIDGQKSAFTNSKGEATTYVPKNTAFYITVHAEDYSNYPNEVKVEVGADELGETGGTKTITLPTVAHISGTVTNQGSGNNVATIWIEYNGKSTKKAHSDLDGKFFILAPADYKGKAVLKVRAANGQVKSVDIELDGKDHAYEISFKSDVNAGAVITFLDETYTLEFAPVEVEGEGGVVIVDGDFSGTTGWGGEQHMEQGGFVYADFSFSGYKEGQTKYSDVQFNIRREGGENQMVGMWGQAGEATITPQKNNYYRVQISGQGQFEGRWDLDPEQREGSMAHGSMDIIMPLFAKGHKLQNVKDGHTVIPSFAPIIPDKTVDYALQVTEAPMLGKGGYLIYRDTELGVDVFDALVEEAKKALGEPENFYRYNDQYNHMGQAAFQSGEKYLYITWNGGTTQFADFMNDPIGIWSLRSYGGGNIVILAYDGYKFTESQRVKGEKFWAARKK